MSICKECGKNLGIFGGYRHPIHGNEKLICGDCLIIINESVDKWRKFVLSQSFNNEKTSYYFNDIVTSFSNFNNKLKKIFTTILSPRNL